MSGIFAELEAMRGALGRDLAAFRDTTWDLRSERALEVRRWFRHFTRLMVRHETLLETLVFPRLRERLPEASAAIAALSAEHAELRALAADIDDALVALAAARRKVDRVVARGSLAVRASRFEVLVGGHLAREEAVVVPLLRAHFDEAALRSLTAQAQRATPLGELGFVLTWLAARLSPESRRRLLGGLPLSLRLLYRWRWRRRYEGLARPLSTSAA